MPFVHDSQPVPKANNVLDPEEVGQHEQVFKIGFTGESFIRYEDYMERLNYYQQNIFTCSQTGKSSLTYEEALASEAAHIRKSKPFPEVFIEPLLIAINYKQSNLSDLVDEVRDIFNKNIYVHEEVCIQKDHKRHHGTVEIVDLETQKVLVKMRAHDLAKESKGQRMIMETFIDMTPNRTETSNPSDMSSIQSDDSSVNRQPPNIENQSVPKSQGEITSINLSKASESAPTEKLPTPSGNDDVISEKPLSFLPDHFDISKKDIQHTAHLDYFFWNGDLYVVVKTQSPYLIRTQRSSITKPMIRDKIKDVSTKDTYIGAPYFVKPELMEAYGMDKTIPTEIQMMLDKNENKKKRKRTNTENEANVSDVKKKFAEVEEADDDLIIMDTTSEDVYSTLIEKFNYDLSVKQGLITDLICIYSFLKRFSEVTQLYPFDFYDLIEALQFEEDTELENEVFMRLLFALEFKDKTNQKQWKTIVHHYLKAHQELFGHVNLMNILGKQGYDALSLSHKVTILAFMCEQCMDSNLIRKEVSDSIERKIQLSKENWEDQMILRRIMKKKTKKKDASKDVQAKPGTPTTNPPVEEEEDDDLKKEDEAPMGGNSSEKIQMYEDMCKDMEKSDVMTLLKENQQEFLKEYHSIHLRMPLLGMDRYYNRYWWFGKLYQEDGDVDITDIEANLLIEYNPNNIEFESHDDLFGYVSVSEDEDELLEELQEEIDSMEEEEPKVVETSRRVSKIASDTKKSMRGDDNEVKETKSRHRGPTKKVSKKKSTRRIYESDEEEEEEEESIQSSDEDYDENREEEEEEESDGSEDTYCQLCMQPTDASKMLLCDACNLGYHMYCLMPPMKKVPRGDWFCDACIQAEQETEQEREQRRKEEEERERKRKEEEEEKKRQREEEKRLRMERRLKKEEEKRQREEERQRKHDAKVKTKLTEMRANIGLLKSYMPKKVPYIWGYIHSQEEVEKLIEALDVRGKREKKLKNNLLKYKEMIHANMNKRMEHFQKENEEMHIISTRRTTRQTEDQRSQLEMPFLKYVNRYIVKSGKKSKKR